jgi:hypothetical protein
MPPNNKNNNNIEIITFNNSLKNEKSIYGKELGLFEESARRCNLKVKVTGKSGNTKRKKSFRARHKCSSAKPGTAKYLSCKNW